MNVRPRSIRARTTLAATVVTALTLAAASVLLVGALRESLTESRDAAARADLDRLVALAKTSRLPRVLPVDEDEMAQVVAPDGSVLAASIGLGDGSAVTSLAPPPGEPALVVLTGVPDDQDVETFRVWATTVAGPEGPLRVYVGTSPERVQEAVRAARSALLVGVPVVVAALAALTSWLVGRSLRPVEDVRSEVSTISDSELHRRVPVPSSGDEIERLARTMNEMLTRLETGSDRQRAFVADASHELLSPITALRTQLEVASASGDPPDPDLLADLTADTDRLERLVRDLLLLTRAEDSTGVDGLPLVDLDTIVLDEVRRLSLPPGLEVDAGGVSAAPVRGRAEDLSRLVRNLLENGRNHASTRVTVSLEERDGVADLVVTDDGPGVPDDLRARVFDRFVTGSAVRREGEGTGLGLAIARAVAVAHGGVLTLDDAPGGAAFRLRLPIG